MHLLLILGVALIFFGPKKLPELGKGLGAGIRDFKKALNSAEAKSSDEREPTHDEDLTRKDP
jgi:sec-independent protein translocase protein TatA